METALMKTFFIYISDRLSFTSVYKYIPVKTKYTTACKGQAGRGGVKAWVVYDRSHHKGGCHGKSRVGISNVTKQHYRTWQKGMRNWKRGLYYKHFAPVKILTCVVSVPIWRPQLATPRTLNQEGPLSYEATTAFTTYEGYYKHRYTRALQATAKMRAGSGSSQSDAAAVVARATWRQ